MAAFLLSWNPDRFAWNALRSNISKIRNKGYVNGRWSCGNRTDMPQGSEFFMIRLGPAPKGIVARGITRSKPFEGVHWDPDRKQQKVKALYVEVRFTDLSETPVISWEALEQQPLSRFKWSIFASGVALPEVIVHELDRRWTIARSKQISWTEHPLADEFSPEFEILKQTDLSDTVKESLIAARRGQGLFRQRVLDLEGRCRVTAVDNADHLRASHIKPWKDSTNTERLSGDNGLMLAPQVDHLFDQGFISFTDFGDLLVSPRCPATLLAAWGIPKDLNVGPFRAGQRPFLAYHRANRLRP